MFIDEVNITVESGAGGRGCVSFFVRTDHKKVPDGGNGGKGGDIVFQADENVTGLEDFLRKRIIRAESGGSGGANLKTGKSSAPVVVRIPCGTLILNRETNLRIRDLYDHGEEVIVAEGGRGAPGNQHGHQDHIPEKGQVVQVGLILKLLSDAVFIGSPSSGKSTLLNQLTHAHTKVGNYPFSTQVPQLGVMEAPDYRQFKLCELPALLEGSHEGKGLGNKFLRHLERTRLIVLVLDPFNENGKNVRENYKVLIHELERYSENILDIPRIIVINKSDRPEFSKKVKNAKVAFKEPTSTISALTGDGVKKFKQELEHRLS